MGERGTSYEGKRPTARSSGNRRVALVIGNSKYIHAGALRNPAEDANGMAAALRRLNFEVIMGLDRKRVEFEQDIRAFAKTIEGADSGVLFYAGHGLQVDGVNYLVPIDAEIEREADVSFNTIKLADILDAMGRTCRTSIIFLDACRNNPFTRSLQRSMGQRSVAVGSGLATVQARPGAFIAYATQPDNVAKDGDGRNSPFTTALLKHIEAPNSVIDSTMYKVSNDVFEATAGAQVPWRHSSLFEPFVFNPIAGLEPAKDSKEQHPWLLLKDSPNPSLIRSFVDQFPNDHYVGEAKQRLLEMEHEAWQGLGATPSSEALQSFLMSFPNGQYAADVQLKLDSPKLQFLKTILSLGLIAAALSAAVISKGDFLSTPHITILNGLFKFAPGAFLHWSIGILLFGITISYGLWKRGVKNRWWLLLCTVIPFLAFGYTEVGPIWLSMPLSRLGGVNYMSLEIELETIAKERDALSERAGAEAVAGALEEEMRAINERYQRLTEVAADTKSIADKFFYFILAFGYFLTGMAQAGMIFMIVAMAYPRARRLRCWVVPLVGAGFIRVSQMVLGISTNLGFPWIDAFAIFAFQIWIILSVANALLWLDGGSRISSFVLGVTKEERVSRLGFVALAIPAFLLVIMAFQALNPFITIQEYRGFMQ